MSCVSLNLNPWSMFLVWQEKLKVKIQLLEGWPLITIESTMFFLVTSLNLQD
jgi:hypothetical protein